MYGLAKGMEAESDQNSEFQLTENMKDRGYADMHHKYWQSVKCQLWEILQIKCPGFYSK